MATQNRLVDSVEVTEDKVHIIHLKNVFDASTAGEFEQVLRYLMTNEHYKFVIDLSRVEFISSAGWGNFIAELQTIRDHKGDIKLAGMNSEVYDVFLLLELDLFIKAYDTVDQALVDFSRNIIGVPTTASKSRDGQASTRSQRAAQGKQGTTGTRKTGKTSKPSERIPSEEIIDPWLKDNELHEFDPNELRAAESREKVKKPARQAPPFGATPRQERQPAGHPQLHGNLPPALKSITSSGEPGATSTPVVSGARQRAAQRQAPPQPLHGASVTSRPKPWNDDKHEVGGHEASGGQNRGKTANGHASRGLRDFMPQPKPAEPETHVRLQYDFQQDPLLEKIVSVVLVNPSYGPSAIRKMLINMHFADESLTRSEVYRKLEQVDLSTRAKRIAFARENAV